MVVTILPRNREGLRVIDTRTHNADTKNLSYILLAKRTSSLCRSPCRARYQVQVLRVACSLMPVCYTGVLVSCKVDNKECYKADDLNFRPNDSNCNLPDFSENNGSPVFQASSGSLSHIETNLGKLT